MSIHLGNKDLINTQQMEVAINGPDGATHLILCTGIANFKLHTPGNIYLSGRTSTFPTPVCGSYCLGRTVHDLRL